MTHGLSYQARRNSRAFYFRLNGGYSSRIR